MAEPNAHHVLDQVQQYLHQHCLASVSDGELLHRYAACGDADAFPALLEWHGPMVLGVCLRILRASREVEDVFQAVFVVLVRKAGSVAVNGSLAGWLYTVANRLSLKVQRRTEHLARRQRSLAEVPEPAEDWSASARELQQVLDVEI